jgi:hypothetical protein
MSMIRQSPGFLASAAVAALLVIKPGAADGTCVPATAPTDLIIGVSDGLAKSSPVMPPAARCLVRRAWALTTSRLARRCKAVWRVM